MGDNMQGYMGYTRRLGTQDQSSTHNQPTEPPSAYPFRGWTSGLSHIDGGYYSTGAALAGFQTHAPTWYTHPSYQRAVAPPQNTSAYVNYHSPYHQTPYYQNPSWQWSPHTYTGTGHALPTNGTARHNLRQETSPQHYTVTAPGTIGAAPPAATAVSDPCTTSTQYQSKYIRSLSLVYSNSLRIPQAAEKYIAATTGSHDHTSRPSVRYATLEAMGYNGRLGRFVDAIYSQFLTAHDNLVTLERFFTSLKSPVFEGSWPEEVPSKDRESFQSSIDGVRRRIKDLLFVSEVYDRSLFTLVEELASELKRGREMRRPDQSESEFECPSTPEFNSAIHTERVSSETSRPRVPKGLENGYARVGRTGIFDSGENNLSVLALIAALGKPGERPRLCVESPREVRYPESSGAQPAASDNLPPTQISGIKETVGESRVGDGLAVCSNSSDADSFSTDGGSEDDSDNDASSGEDPLEGENSLEIEIGRVQERLSAISLPSDPVESLALVVDEAVSALDKAEASEDDSEYCFVDDEIAARGDETEPDPAAQQRMDASSRWNEVARLVRRREFHWGAIDDAMGCENTNHRSCRLARNVSLADTRPVGIASPSIIQSDACGATRGTAGRKRLLESVSRLEKENSSVPGDRF